MNSIQLLIKEALKNTELTLFITNGPRQMASYKVFRTFLILDFTVKFLQKQNPSHKSRLSILLREKVLKGRVVGANNHM